MSLIHDPEYNVHRKERRRALLFVVIWLAAFAIVAYGLMEINEWLI